MVNGCLFLKFRPCTAWRCGKSVSELFSGVQGACKAQTQLLFSPFKGEEMCFSQGFSVIIGLLKVRGVSNFELSLCCRIVVWSGQDAVQVQRIPTQV